jgi:hypothetical protein
VLLLTILNILEVTIIFGQKINGRVYSLKISKSSYSFFAASYSFFAASYSFFAASYSFFAASYSFFTFIKNF